MLEQRRFLFLEKQKDWNKLKLLRLCRKKGETYNSSVEMVLFNSVNVTDKDVVFLKGLESLGLLELGNTQVTGKGLHDMALPRLAVLHLGKCPVTDATVAWH